MMDFVFMEKHKTKAPPGTTPTHGAHAEPGRERGPGPPTRAGEARAPRGAGRLRERRKEKGDYGELQLAVCKRKYEGAELRYSRPKPAAVNANSLSFTSSCQRRGSPRGLPTEERKSVVLICLYQQEPCISRISISRISISRTSISRTKVIISHHNSRWHHHHHNSEL